MTLPHPTPRPETGLIAVAFRPLPPGPLCGLWAWIGVLCLLALPVLSVLAQQAPRPATPSQPRRPSPQATVGADGRPIVQFTGLVVAGENAFGVPGVQVRLLSTRRGVLTNHLGYFSIPVLAGDTALIAAAGYRRERYVVPDSRNQSHSVIIYLQADTLQLPVVEVSPYPTEDLFKQAFLALDVRDRDVMNARSNLDPYKIEEIAAETPMDGRENFTVASRNTVVANEQRRMAPQLQLLNPFAWATFINQIKRGDFNRKRDARDREE